MVLDIGFRNDDVASNYNGGVSSSSPVSSSTTQEFSTKNGFEEEEEGGEKKMKGFVRRSRDLFLLICQVPKEIFLMQKESNEEDQKS